MPEEIQDSQVQENPIYKFMKSNNLTKLDEKAFLNTYSKPEKAKEIHSFMVSNDLTKLDESKFYDSYLKKKDQTLPSGEISSLTELPSSFIEPLKKGVAPSKNIGEERAMRQLGVRPYAGVTIPTNLPKQDALRYEKELKVQDAAINTLTDVYKQKGLKFDPLKPAAQKQIQDYIDKEKNNDLGLVEGIKDKKPYLTRTTGLGETLYSTAIESFKEPIKSTKINTIINPKEFADFADEEIKNTPNVPESVPSNIGGYLGQLGGALPKLVAEEAVGGPALVAAEMYWNGIANQRKALYQKGLDQGMDRIQAAQMAMDNATTSAIPDFIVGAILTVGVKGHTGILKQGTADAFKDAMKNVVKSSPKMFAVGAGAEFGRAETQKQAGYKVDRTEEVENMFRGGGDLAKMDAAFKTAMAAPYVPKILYAAAKNVLSETPKPVLDALAQKYGDNGKVIDDVSKFAETKAEVQDLVPEAKVASVTGLTQKVKNIQKDIDELTARREKTTDALKPQIDSWIKEYQDEINFYNKQINKVVESKDPTGVTEEVDDITGQKIGTKQYVVDGKEVSQQEFEAMQDKPIGTKEVIKAEVKPEEIELESVTSKDKNEKFDTPTLKSPASKFEKIYVPRNVVEEAYKNDKDNNPVFGNGNQPLNRIIERGGYSIEELDNLLPNWKEIASAKEVKPTEVKRIVEPSKAISEMNSEELDKFATETRKALKKQDKYFEGKTEKEKEDGGYYDVIDEVEDLRDASERINFIENAENVNDLANSVKSTLSNIKGKEPNEYQLAILNAAKNKAIELNIDTKDLIKNISYKIKNQYEDVEDAELMVKSALEKLIPQEVKPTKVKAKEYKEKSIQKENERAKFLGFDTEAKDALSDINEVLNENYDNLYEVNSVAAYKAKKLIDQSNKIKEKVITPELKNITPKNIEDKLRHVEFQVTHNENGRDIHHGSDVTKTGSKIIRNNIEYPTYVITGRNENNYFDFIINDNGEIEPVSGYDISDIKVRQFPKSEIDVKDTAKKLQDIADSRQPRGKIDEKTYQLYNDVEKMVGGRNGFDYSKNKWEDVAKFYHKALKDGSNPELVKMVSDYLEGSYTPKEPKVYNAKDLKKNPKILEEDEDAFTLTYPRSFVSMSTNMLALKNAGYEKAKIGDIINVFKKDYVIRDFGEEKKNPDNKIVSLIRVDKDGNILRERDLSAKESKAGMAKEFEEEEELEVEKPELSKDDIKKAEAKFAAAEDRFKKARNKIEATQVKQAGMFGGEQKGMFAMGGEEAKSTLDPLRKAAKEAKAELDNIRNKFKVQGEAQSELTPVEEEPRGYYKGVYKGERMKFVKPIEKTYEGEKVTEGNIKQKAKDKYIQLTDDEGVIRNYSGKIKDASFKRNGKQVFSIESKENDSILSFIINDKGEIEMDGSGGNIYKIKLTTELETETLPVINANIEKLRNDRDFGIQDQPESFVEKWVPFNELKENNLKEGNIVNFEGKKYLVERISENNNGKKTKAHLFEIGKDGNLLREVDIRPYQQALKEKQEAEKRLTRQVGAEKANVTKEIYRRVSQTERQLGSGEEGAQEIALRYLADGGKVSKAAVDEAYGSAKRAQLNVKRREFLSEEVKSKDFVQGNEKLDDLAHRLWQDNKQKISEIDIKDKLMAEIGNNNSRLEAAEAYLDNYNAEYKQEKEEIRMAEEYKAEYLEEQEKLEKELREPLKQQIEGEASEEHVNNLIDQYESEIKGEDQQFGPESEGEVNKEAGKRKVSEKIEEKSVEEAYKDLTIIEKRQIINSKFDELLKELKIEKICPTD